MNQTMVFRTQMPSYSEYWIPEGGCLPPNYKPVSALWHYYVIARLAWERQNSSVRITETGHMGHSVGEQTDHNYHQLFNSIARAYNVDPHEMAQFWPSIDSQAEKLELPLLPNKEEFRFNSLTVIN